MSLRATSARFAVSMGTTIEQVCFLLLLNIGFLSHLFHRWCILKVSLLASSPQVASFFSFFSFLFVLNEATWSGAEVASPSSRINRPFLLRKGCLFFSEKVSFVGSANWKTPVAVRRREGRTLAPLYLLLGKQCRDSFSENPFCYRYSPACAILRHRFNLRETTSTICGW